MSKEEPGKAAPEAPTQERPAAGKEPDVKPEAGKQPEQKKHEPPEGSQRWNELYKERSEFKRKSEETERDLDLLRKHTRQLAEKLEKIDKEKADRPKIAAPNPAEDYDAWLAWQESERINQQKSWQQTVEQTKNENMIMMMNAIYDDYEENAAVAEREMEKNPSLREEIFSKPNPYKAAYEFGKKKKNGNKADPSPSPVDVESGGEHAPSDKDEDWLSDEEMRVAKLLWTGMPVAEMKKRYKMHREAMRIGERRQK